MIKLCLLLCSILLIAITNADQQYRVVAPNGSKVQVSIGGHSYSLSRVYSDVPYFVGSVSTTSLSYAYIVDGVTEKFTRTFPSGRSATYNDFIGRKDTIETLFTLGQAYPAWTRGLGPSGVFNDDYISTVFFTGSGAQSYFKGSKSHPSADPITVTFINRDDVGRFTDAYADGKNGDSNPKVEILLHLRTPYHNRNYYKFRPSEYDPIFFREKLYNDILSSIGVPHQQTSFTRVYTNNKGQGLYHLQEDVSSTGFVRTEFNGNNLNAPVGIVYDAGTGADFGTNHGYGDIYSFIPKDGSDDHSKIQALENAVDAVNWKSDSSVATFNQNWFDLDTFMRAMVVEWLAGHWDSYWFQTSNFAMYNDPSQSSSGHYRFWFIDQDFDQTFGVGLSFPVSKYVVSPYTDYVNRKWSSDTGSTKRVMIDDIMSNPTKKSLFEDMIRQIVHVTFNPIALGARIDSIMERIRPDIVWDRTLGNNRARPGNLAYDVSDYDANLNDEVDGNPGLLDWINDRANYAASTYHTTFQNPPSQGTSQ